MVALLRARPEVKTVYDYANTGDSTMISGNGNLTVVVATVGNVQEKQAVTALQHAIAAQPDLKGNTWLGGPTTADVQIAAVSSQDLGRAELFALPFLLSVVVLRLPRRPSGRHAPRRRRVRHRHHAWASWV